MLVLARQLEAQLGVAGRQVEGAELACVCGYGRPADVAPALVAKPIWAFHGIDDKTVPVQQSKDLCAAVEKQGGHPVLTLYEHTAHNSWDKAYGESSLAEWLRIVPLIPFSPYDVFAAALQDRPRPHRFGFEIEIATTQERVTMWLHAQEAGWKWGREHECSVMSPTATRPAYAADREPETGKLSAREGEASFAECVRILVRGGVLDTVPGERAEGGAYVSFDVMGVPGGERPRRYWPVRNALDPAVEAIQRVSEKIAQFR